jgi:hypothetical protein
MPASVTTLRLQYVGVFWCPPQETLAFELVNDGLTGQHIDAEEPLHLMPGELKAGHLAVLGLDDFDEADHSRLQ